MNRTIRRILTWWESRHPPCAKIPGWRAAYRAEKRALAAGCTREVGKARKAMREALHRDMRGMA